MDDVHKQLDATLRVGELESTASLLRHKLKVLARDLENSRALNAEYEHQLQDKDRQLAVTGATPIDFAASVPRDRLATFVNEAERERFERLEAERDAERVAQQSQCEAYEQRLEGSRQRITQLQEMLASAGSARTAAAQEADQTRQQLRETQQLAEERAADVAQRGRELAGLTVLLKDRTEVLASLQLDAAAWARERQAILTELGVVRQESATAQMSLATALAEKADTHTTEQRRESERERKLRLEIESLKRGEAATTSEAASLRLRLATITEDASSLRSQLSSVQRELREALEEAEALTKDAQRLVREVARRDDQLLVLSEEHSRLQYSSDLLAAEHASMAATVAGLASSATPAATADPVSLTPQKLAGIRPMIEVNGREQLLALLQRHERKKGSNSDRRRVRAQQQLMRERLGMMPGGGARAASPNSSPNNQRLDGGAGLAGMGSADFEEEAITAVDLSCEDWAGDSDDDLALPIVVDREESQLDDFPSDDKDPRQLAVGQEEAKVTLILPLTVLLDHVHTSHAALVAQYAKAEKRLRAEADNVGFERDQYRQEIMRFLEIDAASAASSSSSTTPSREQTPTKASAPTRSSGTPKRADELIATTVASASAAVQAAYVADGVGNVPRRTMAILRGFAEQNGRLQAQVVHLVGELEDARRLLQQARLAEQVALTDLMKAEDHNQQLNTLTAALKLAVVRPPGPTAPVTAVAPASVVTTVSTGTSTSQPQTASTGIGTTGHHDTPHAQHTSWEPEG